MSDEVNAGRRLVVYTSGSGGLELPPATAFGGRWIGGGVRTLHELAFAAAASGRDVELRGFVLHSAFEELAAVTGVRPRLPTTPRRPDPDDVVVIPEGDDNVWCVGRVALSAARGVILLLAPPGLFGWTLVPDWAPASPLTVERAALARPEHFHALASVGLTVWTNMQRIHELSEKAGVACRMLGNGSPHKVPEPADKSVDVAWLQANRWSSFAAEAAAKLGDEISVDAIEDVDHDEMLRRLGAARVLLWPSRIEGHARISGEARLRGCVPVALSSNEFATGLDERSGTVVVDTLAELPAAAEALLSDPGRLAELADRGRSAAQQQLDWDAYVTRVDAALHDVEQAPRPTVASPLAGFGIGVAEEIDTLGEQVAALEAHLGTLQDERADATRALEAVTAARDHAVARHDMLKARKSVRIALRAADLRLRR